MALQILHHAASTRSWQAWLKEIRDEAFANCGSRHRPVSLLAITPGEPAGIGPDLIVMLAQQERTSDWVALADAETLKDRAGRAWPTADADRPADPARPVACASNRAAGRTRPAGRLNPANAPAVIAAWTAP